MTEYARRTFGKESPEAQQAYLLGDMNTTLIHTVKGKTIQLQYCTVHPRPYSRSHTICGTRGFAQKYPVATINLEDVRSGGAIGTAAGETASATTEELLQHYQHPFTATIGKEGALKGAPNEMNYIMDTASSTACTMDSPWIWTSTMPPNGRASPSSVSNRY